MIPDRQQRQRDESRVKRAAILGRYSLAMMAAFVLFTGSLSLFRQTEFMLLLCLFILPLTAWMAVRCLQTPEAGGKIDASITLALIILILVFFLIELGPWIVSYYSALGEAWR